MIATGLQCIRCGTRYPLGHHSKPCEACQPGVSSALTIVGQPDRPAPGRNSFADGVKSMWRYDHTLPVAAVDAVSLGEGLTPLVHLRHLGGALGIHDLFGKCEFMNPTGSFKDRLASSAISAAKNIFGAKVIVTSSTGNAGASAAAYAVKAGLDCIIFTTASANGPLLAQMQAYGATVVATPSKADRWVLMKQGVDRFGWFPTSPFFAPPIGSNPFGVEGYKTLAYEIAQEFGWSGPDWLVLPVCYGDAIYGIWKGFRELIELGWVKKMPRFVAAEIYGSVSAAFESGSDVLPLMEQSYQTAATSITSPQGTFQTLSVVRSTNGRPVRIMEDELQAARREIAASEGLYVETAAAATVVASRRLRQEGLIHAGDSVVCLLTATGLKEAPSMGSSNNPVIDVPADLDEMLAIVHQARGMELSP
jgi:threonine synthase